MHLARPLRAVDHHRQLARAAVKAQPGHAASRHRRQRQLGAACAAERAVERAVERVVDRAFEQAQGLLAVHIHGHSDGRAGGAGVTGRHVPGDVPGQPLQRPAGQIQSHQLLKFAGPVADDVQAAAIGRPVVDDMRRPGAVAFGGQQASPLTGSRACEVDQPDLAVGGRAVTRHRGQRFVWRRRKAEPARPGQFRQHPRTLSGRCQRVNGSETRAHRVPAPRGGGAVQRHRRNDQLPAALQPAGHGVAFARCGEPRFGASLRVQAVDLGRFVAAAVALEHDVAALHRFPLRIDHTLAALCQRLQRRTGAAQAKDLRGAGPRRPVADDHLRPHRMPVHKGVPRHIGITLE